MFLTLRQHLSALNKMVAEHPETLNHFVVTAVDEEGNEYRRVCNSPALIKIEMEDIEFSGCDVIDMYNPNNSDLKIEGCNAVLIN